MVNKLIEKVVILTEITLPVILVTIPPVLIFL